MEGLVLNFNTHNNNSNISFSGNKRVTKHNNADKFINELNKADNRQYKDGFFSKFSRLPLLSLVLNLGLLGYGISLFRKAKKIENNSKIEKQLFVKKTSRNMLIGAIGVLALNYIAGYFANLTYDKNLKEQKKLFNSLNQTHAKLSDRTFVSNIMGAMYSPISGEITLNKTSIIDPCTRYKNKFILKHELVHAKQYEMIARSKDGIKKLNYATMKGIANQIKSNKFISNFYNLVYLDVLNDKTHKYDNITVKIQNANVNFKDYINALHTLCTKENATYNDIPMIINKEHYEKVRKDMPKLTQEEEKKAEQYYQAVIKYKPISFFQILNPFGEYYNNILEKEAYKEYPWWTRII